MFQVEKDAWSASEVYARDIRYPHLHDLSQMNKKIKRI